MDLKQLRTFVHVADLGSLSKAADRLHVAQPALGRQIKLLEDDLGVRLFTRHGRGMVATVAGKILAERATAILRLVEDMRDEVAAEPASVSGTVSLGVPPTVGEVLTGPLVETFVKRHSAVTVRIVPAFSGYLLDLLQRGEIDVAVVYEGGGAREVHTEPLIEENLFLIGSRTAKLDLRRPVRFSGITGYPMILPGLRQGLRRLIEAEARKIGSVLQCAIEAESLQTLKDLVARGLGYTILPLAVVRAEIEAGILRAAPIGQPALVRKLVLARSLARPASNATRIFAESLKTETARLVEEGAWGGRLLFKTTA